MTLTPGARLGAYEILSSLGVGGMGEVYRASDINLKRQVAIKVLPVSVATDADRVARFQREAEVLAALNHPNIAHIFGLEKTDGTIALAMELVEGPTLADRIAQGPIPVDEALLIAKQIAEALDAAHEQGIIHRDLKPPNIKLRPDGVVKVLDFGLAKTLEPVSAGSTHATASPTITSPAMMTSIGVILGTAAYMSPEQARGLPLDKRTDIWGFGCVLYEMLTGNRAFGRKTISDTIAAILHDSPDWSALPKDVPRGLHALLRHCLVKDAKLRLRDVGDVRFHLSDESGEASTVTGNERRSYRALFGVGAVAAVVLIAAIGVWRLKSDASTADHRVVRLVVALPAGEELAAPASMVALSRDGRHLAYVSRHVGASRIFVRSMDHADAQLLPGTEGATRPFFSADGRWVGFFADGKLKKVSIEGGPALVLCDASSGVGGTWADDETIFFAPQLVSGIWRVSAQGGSPTMVTAPNRKNGEVGHETPQILPGGNALLFTVSHGPGDDEAQIHLQKLDTGERRVLVQRGRRGSYVPSGHILYLAGGKMFAVAFDLVRHQVTGNAPTPVVEDVWDWVYSSAYAVSDTGTLVYLQGSADSLKQLVWVDRGGKAVNAEAPPRVQSHPRLSPNSQHAAVQVLGPTEDIWVFDFVRATSTRLTTEDGSAQRPVWTPDGKRLTYRVTRDGYRNLFWKPVDASAPEKRLTVSENYETPTSWSPDGTVLAFSRDDIRTGSDIWVLQTSSRRVTPFVQTPFNEDLGRFSTDGHWLAYVSNESGRNEVYVLPFPDRGRRWQISTDGGRNPVWAPSGRELFYQNRDEMMQVGVVTQPTFAADKPRFLFKGAFTTAPDINYDVTPDGQRFLMLQTVEPARAMTKLQVVLNWSEELKQRVPTR